MNDIKNLLESFVKDPENPENNYFLGCYYENLKQYSSAGSYYLRAAERYEDDLFSYESLIRLALCFIKLGRRKYSTKAMLNFAISKMPKRPEAYYLLSNYIENNEQSEDKWFNAHTLASVALSACNFEDITPLRKSTEYQNRWSLVFQKAHTGYHSGFIEKSRELFLSIVKAKDAPESIKKLSLSNLMNIKKENDRSFHYHRESDMKDVYDTSLSKYVLQNGGSIHPIDVPYQIPNGKATLNASVFVDSKDQAFVNLRESNYTLYYSKKFPTKDGPFKYLYPDNDINIRSENIICKLDDDLNVSYSSKIDMKLNESPNWFYIGLEDARLIEWNGKKYICGVRRDHIEKGKGRIDLSEIELTENGAIEVNRFSIPTPDNIDSYCEKNWMPILDQPFHWVKWTNPTQVVSFDPKTFHTQTVVLDENKRYDFPRDLKGGSQVIRWKDDYYLAITHECIYSKINSDRRYLQRIVVWDKNWNIVCSTRDFTMMSGSIEFVSGIAYHKNDVLISYGYEDNASYILKVPKPVFDDFVLRG